MEQTLSPMPEGNKFYGLLQLETLQDGWRYGYITQAPCSLHPEGYESGDGYVVAPDGIYAGLIWSISCPSAIQAEVSNRTEKELLFGVFEVRFGRPVASTEDLVTNFLDVLPLLQVEHWC